MRQAKCGAAKEYPHETCKCLMVGSVPEQVGRAVEKAGGRTRIRTLDPLIKSQLLYQLSYAPSP